MASLETNAHLVEKNISSRHIETMYIDDTYHVVTLDKRKDDIGKRMAEFCIHVVHLKKERS
jgi:carboxylesterase